MRPLILIRQQVSKPVSTITVGIRSWLDFWKQWWSLDICTMIVSFLRSFSRYSRLGNPVIMRFLLSFPCQNSCEVAKEIWQVHVYWIMQRLGHCSHSQDAPLGVVGPRAFKGFREVSVFRIKRHFQWQIILLVAGQEVSQDLQGFLSRMLRHREWFWSCFLCIFVPGRERLQWRWIGEFNKGSFFLCLAFQFSNLVLHS